MSGERQDSTKGAVAAAVAATEATRPGLSAMRRFSTENTKTTPLTMSLRDLPKPSFNPGPPGQRSVPAVPASGSFLRHPMERGSYTPGPCSSFVSSHEHCQPGANLGDTLSFLSLVSPRTGTLTPGAAGDLGMDQQPWNLFPDEDNPPSHTQSSRQSAATAHDAAWNPRHSGSAWTDHNKGTGSVVGTPLGNTMPSSESKVCSVFDCPALGSNSNQNPPLFPTSLQSGLARSASYAGDLISASSSSVSVALVLRAP